jgi:hypothetical protein
MCTFHTSYKNEAPVESAFNVLPLYKPYNPDDIRICEVGKDEQIGKKLDSSRPQWIDVEPKNRM